MCHKISRQCKKYCLVLFLIQSKHFRKTVVFVRMPDIMELVGICLIKLNILFFIFLHGLILFGQAQQATQFLCICLPPPQQTYMSQVENINLGDKMSKIDLCIVSCFFSCFLFSTLHQKWGDLGCVWGGNTEKWRSGPLLKPSL